MIWPARKLPVTSVQNRKRSRGQTQAQAEGAKSLRAIATVLNAANVPTARGGRWEAATVRNVFKRIS